MIKKAAKTSKPKPARRKPSRSRAASGRHESLFHTLSLGVIYLGPEGEILDANPKAEEILGRSLADLKGRKNEDQVWRTVREDGGEFPPGQHPASIALSTGKPVLETIVGVYNPRRRQRRWVMLNAVPEFKPRTKKPFRVHVTFNDITESKTQREAFLESEKKFRQVIESSPMGIHLYELRSGGRLIFTGANPAADRILGVDNRQFIGKTIEEAFPPLVQTEIPERYRRACALGESWRTSQIDYQDGRINGAFEVYAFQTAPGKMAAMFLDVTGRAVMEYWIKQSEEKYRLLIETTRTGFVILDQTGMVIDANHEYIGMTGRTRDQVIHHRVTEWTAEYDRERNARAVAQCLKRGSVSGLHVDYLKPDGSAATVEIHASVTGDGEKRILTICRDVTEQRRAENLARQQAAFRDAIIRRAMEGICVCHNVPDFPYVQFTVWNDRMTEITGYTMEEINRLGWYQSMYPDPEVQARAASRMANMREGDDILAEEWTVTGKGGEKRGIHISTTILSREGGTTYVMALMRDVTSEKRAREDLAVRLEIERIVADASSTFINLPAGDIDRRIDESLGRLAGFLGADRGYLFRQREGNWTNTHEWCGPGIEPAIGRWQDVPGENFPLAWNVLERFKVLSMTVADLPVGAERAEFEAEGIKNLVCVPVASHGELVGFIGFDWVRAGKAWPEDVVGLLRVAGESFIGALERKAAEESLRFKGDFEALLTSISTRFINLPSEGLREEMDRALGEIGKFLDVDRAYIIEFPPDYSEFSCTAEWARPGLSHFRKVFQRIPTRSMPWWIERMKRGEIQNLSGPSDIPGGENEARKMMAMVGVISEIEIPLMSAGVVRGTLGFATTRGPRRWDEEHFPLLRVIAEIFLGARERINMEQAVRRSEERFRSLFDHTPVGIWEEDFSEVKTFLEREYKTNALGADRDQLVKKINGLVKMLGVNQASLDLFEAGDINGLERNIENIFTERSFADFQSGLGAILTGETELELETEIVTLQGNRRDIIMRWTVPPGHEKTFDRVLVSMVDITERKAAERELSENRRQLAETHEMLRLAFDTVPVRVFWKDRDLVYLGCNRLFAQDAGRQDPEELIGRDDFEMGWRDQAELYRGDDREVITTGRAKIGYEEPQTTPDGGRIWLRTSKVPLRDHQGNIIGVLGTYEDITERKKAEEALVNSEKWLATTLNSVGDAVITTGMDGRVTFLNQVAAGLTGWDPEAARGRPLAEVFPIINEQTRQPVEDPVAKVLREKKVVGLANHTALLSRGGREISIADSGAPIMDAKGEILGVVLVFRDVSEQRANEARLRQQQKLESIGTLAGGVAHEINNPIGVIMNFAELIAHESPGEGHIRENALTIFKEGERIAGIVKNLLSFSRAEKESYSPALLSDIVNTTVSLVRKVLARDMIELDIDLQPDLPKIKCRSQQIMQVLMNLITNARDSLNLKYPGHHEEKRIRVSARLFEQQGKQWVRVEVMDKGGGIPLEVQPRIFDPFFTTKPRDQGTGLGLSISHGIAQDHGGRLDFETVPGEFTRFFLDLPVDNGWRKEDE